MGRSRANRKRKLPTQSGGTRIVKSSRSTVQEPFSNLGDVDKELLSYHNFIITKPLPKTAQETSIQIFERLVVEHLRQVCAVRWTLKAIRHKLKSLFNASFLINSNLYHNGILRSPRLPKELRTWIEQRTLELRRHAFVVARSDGAPTERLTRSESLALGAAAPQHMILNTDIDSTRKSRNLHHKDHNTLQNHETTKIESPISCLADVSIRESLTSGRIDQPNGETSIAPSTWSDTQQKDCGTSTLSQDGTTQQTVGSAPLLSQNAGLGESRSCSSPILETNNIKDTCDIKDLPPELKISNTILDLMQIQRNHEVGTAVLLEEIKSLKAKLRLLEEEKERCEFACDQKEKYRSEPVSFEQLKSELVAKDAEVRGYEKDIQKEKKKLAFYRATDSQAMSMARGKLRETAESFKDEVERFLDLIQPAKAITITNCVENKILLQLLGSCFGVADTTESYVILIGYPCESEAVVPLARALLSSAVISWVFSQPLPGIEKQTSMLLTKYRQLIFKQNGRDSLRCLDYVAHDDWLEEKGNLNIRRRSAVLASNFMTTLRPLFEDAGEWMEQENSVKSIFQKAFDLKVCAVQNLQVLEAIMFRPGASFNASMMDEKDSRPWIAASKKVSLCMIPAIMTYDDDNELVDACSFVQTRSQGENGTRPGGRLIKASVILEVSKPSASFIEDSETEA